MYNNNSLTTVEWITIISGIASLIAIIVFFVMAGNIGIMKKELINMRELFTAYATRDELFFEIECPHCHSLFQSIEKYEYKCPLCTRKFKDSDLSDIIDDSTIKVKCPHCDNIFKAIEDDHTHCLGCNNYFDGSKNKME
jgi:DNA-directed RNA polymerase subunit RPC12/RpoP